MKPTLKLKSWHSLTVLIAVTFLLMACTAVAPTPTPDLLFERMTRDLAVQDLKAEAPSIALLIAPNGYYSSWLTYYLELYVPVYMASACLGGTEPSREGFRDLVTTGVVMGSSGRVRLNLQSLAHQVIQAISEKGQEAATNLCLQPYLDPKSMADAAPAVDLCLALTLLDLPSRLRDGHVAVTNGRASEWFNTTEPRQPFLPWLCGQ